MSTTPSYRNKFLASLAVSAVLLSGCATAPAAPAAASVERVASVAPVSAAAVPTKLTTVNYKVKTNVNLNLRKSSTVNSKSLAIVTKGSTLTATAKASNGWFKVTYKGKTGYVSNKYAKKVGTTSSSSNNSSGGRAVSTGNYTSNRAGLTDRYFTKNNGADLFKSVGGSKRISDIPANSIVYRDIKLEKKGGQRAGWYFVRTQGTSGWMKSSTLKKTSNAATSNSKGYTRSQARKQTNGKISSSMLVAIPWDKEKTLIAAPALKDLTRMNTAFKARFGKNLDIDLAYRTRSTQDYLMKELGPYIAAKPGTSNHGWGMAIDVPETYDYSFRGKYYKWLKANSKKYNWIHQGYLEEYRNGKLNPYREAWHFEYVGK